MATNSYVVRSAITYGTAKDDGAVETKEYLPGDKISLTEDEARSIRHALEEPPPISKKRRQTAMSGDVDAALDSIRKRPDNPDSGVMLHWQTDVVAQSGQARVTETEEVGHGFERANAGTGTSPFTGVSGPFVRPEANKTEMELEDEESVKAFEDKLKKDSQTRLKEKAEDAPPATTPAPPVPPKK